MGFFTKIKMLYELGKTIRVEKVNAAYISYLAKKKKQEYDIQTKKLDALKDKIAKLKEQKNKVSGRKARQAYKDKIERKEKEYKIRYDLLQKIITELQHLEQAKQAQQEKIEGLTTKFNFIKSKLWR